MKERYLSRKLSSLYFALFYSLTFLILVFNVSGAVLQSDTISEPILEGIEGHTLSVATLLLAAVGYLVRLRDKETKQFRGDIKVLQDEHKEDLEKKYQENMLLYKNNNDDHERFRKEISKIEKNHNDELKTMFERVLTQEKKNSEMLNEILTKMNSSMEKIIENNK